MPISVQTPIIEHVPNGVTTVFAYPFAILAEEDLKATLDGAAFTAFTVSGVGSRTGGSITCTSAPTGSSLIIYREISLERTTDYQELGDLLAEVLDDDFDRAWMALQDQLLIASRAIRAPLGETFDELPAAASRALRVLGFDASGAPIMLTRTDDGGSALALELLDDTDAAAGSGLVGFGWPIPYPDDSIGGAIRQFDIPARLFGSTDGYARLQAAADAAAGVTPGGASVKAGFGTWSLGGTGVTMKNRVRLNGDGMPYIGTSSTSATAPTVFSSTGASAVRFGDGSTFGTQGGSLENVEVYGGAVGTSGIVFNGTAGSNAGGNVVRNVHINSFTAYGLNGVAHSFVNHLENVSASNCLAGFYLQEGCNDWTLIGAKGQANGNNFVIGKGSGTSQSAIRLIAPKSEDATAEGILIQNPTRSIDINGLYSEGHGKEGIKNLATSATVSIQGGEMNGPSGTYSHINLAAGCIFDIEGVSFAGDAKNDIELSGGGNFYGRIGPCRHGSTNVGSKIDYSGAGASSIVEVFDTSASEHFFVYGNKKSYGAFTPTVKGGTVAGAGTYTTQVGEYTRAQNRVHFSLNLVVTAHTGTGNLQLDLNDIPWTPSATAGRIFPCTVHAENLTFTGQLCATMNPGDKTVYLRQMATGVASTQPAIDTAFSINVSGSFPV